MSTFSGGAERLAFVLDLNANGAIQGFRRVGDAAEREIGKADDRLDKLGSRMQAVGAGAVAFAGVAGRGMASLVSAFEEAEAESRKLEQGLESNADAAEGGREAYDELAASLQDLTGADGDALVGLQGFLATAGRTREEILELTPLVNDLASRFGLDLTAAGRLVNNAMEGQSSRLERLIGQMREGESVADALARTVGGFAEREAQSLSGQLEILKQNLGDVAEGLGAGVAGAVNDVVGPLGNLANNLSETNPQALETAGRIGAIGTAAIGTAGAASFLIGTGLRMRDNLAAIGLSGRTAAAGLGAATAAATAFALVQQANSRAEGMAQTFRNDVAAAVEASTTYDQFRERVDAVGVAYEDLSSDLAGSQAPWDADKRGEIRAGMDALAGYSTETSRLNDEIVALAAAEGISLDQATRRILATESETRERSELVDAIGEEAVAEQESTDAKTAMAAALDRATRAADRNRQAEENRLEALRQSLPVELQFASATSARERAEQRYREAMADGEATALDREEASTSLLQAYVAEADAAAAAAENTATAQGRANTAVQEGVEAQTRLLQELADQFGEGSPVRTALLEHIWYLNEAERDRTATLTIRYEVDRSALTDGLTPQEQRLREEDRDAKAALGAKAETPVVVNQTFYGEPDAWHRELGRQGAVVVADEIIARTNAKLRR